MTIFQWPIFFIFFLYFSLTNRPLAERMVDVLVQPVVDQLDDDVAIAVEEHFVHVAVNAHVLEPDEVVFRAGLIQPLRHAGVKHAVIGSLGGDREDAQAFVTDQLVRRLILHVAAHFIGAGRRASNVLSIPKGC